MPFKGYSREEIKQKLHQFIDAAPILMAFVDQNEHYIFVNKTYENIFGKKNDTIEGRHISEVMGKEFYERGKHFFKRALNGETVFREINIRDRDGKELRLEVSYVPYREGDEIIGMVVTGHDITARWAREMDQALLGNLSAIYAQNLDEKETIRNVLGLLKKRLDCSALWLGEIIIDDVSVDITYEEQEGTPILGMNVPLTNYGTGLSQAYLNGEIVTINDIETDSKTKDNVASFTPLKIRSFLTIPLKRKGQLRAIVSVAKPHPHFWSSQEIVLAQSVSETLWTNIENSRILTELKQSLRARDEFIGICSHELKTPISSLKLIYEMAGREMKNNDPRLYSEAVMRKRIQISNTQIQRMSKLIDEMLEVSRLTSAKLTLSLVTVDLKATVMNVIDLFQEQLDDHHIKVTLNAPDPVLISGDQFRIEQVITNLLTNAIRYGRSMPITVVVTQTQHSGVLRVKDEGIGMSKEDLKKIFHRFERAIDAKDVSGLGLGLYITSQIVEAHNGSIHVESETGKGSEFVVELPLVQGPGK